MQSTSDQLAVLALRYLEYVKDLDKIDELETDIFKTVKCFRTKLFQNPDIIVYTSKTAYSTPYEFVVETTNMWQTKAKFQKESMLMRHDLSITVGCGILQIGISVYTNRFCMACLYGTKLTRAISEKPDENNSITRSGCKTKEIENLKYPSLCSLQEQKYCLIDKSLYDARYWDLSPDIVGNWESSIIAEIQIENQILIGNEPEEHETESNLPECPICSEDLLSNKPKLLPCNHVLCRKCTKGILRNTKACPYCSKKIKNGKECLEIIF